MTLYTQGQQIKVFSQISYYAHKKGFTIPKLKPETQFMGKYEGAIVLDAKAGAYKKPVTALDFASLYPNIIIASDDIYEHIIFNEKKFVNILNVCPDLYNQTVILNGVSKAYAMTGWRIGYAAGPQDIINAMGKIQGQATSCANSIGQIASIEALTGDQSCVEEMRLKFKERRNYIVKLLNNLPNINCAKPGGAFYVFPDFSYYLGHKGDDKILKDTFDISEYILKSAQVVTVPGDGFGGAGHIRFSYATNKDTIKSGIERVSNTLKKLN